MSSLKYRNIRLRFVICLALAVLILLAAVSGCSKKGTPAPTQTPGPAQTPVQTAGPSPTLTPVEPGVVIPSAPVETKRVKGLSISDEILNLHIGDSATLTVSVEPEDATRKSVTWSSGNSLIAEISEESDSSAKITGKSEGTVLITAVSEDGGKMAACIVTVTSPEPEIPIEKIAIEPSDPILTIGSTLRLVVTLYPGNASAKDLVWSSSAPHVAMVSKDGVVSAVGVGKAVISVKTADGSVTASCTVDVRDLSVPVTGITLNMDSAILKVGDFLALTATVRPDNATNKQVNWSSSDERVVTVNAAGEVRAVGVGTAKVLASTSDGNITAVCEIEVTPAEIELEGIELNTKSQYLKVGGTTKLTARAYPEGAQMPPLVWESSDESIVTVTPSGELKARAVGVATVTVSTKDGRFSASCSVIVSR